MSNIGSRIYTNFKRPSNQLVESFRGLPVANIADNMNRFNCVAANISPLNNKDLLGVAFTVKSRTGDNLLLHKALDIAKPGDVIIVDVQGDMVNAVTGEIMVRYAMRKGIAGFVIDGAVRDLDAINNLDFPVYAKGINPKGPYKDGPGEINVPVSCGGVVVRPGDIIVGDGDGLVVIPPDAASIICEKTKRKFYEEEAAIKSIEEGNYDRSWVDEKLKTLGYKIFD